MILVKDYEEDFSQCVGAGGRVPTTVGILQ